MLQAKVTTKGQITLPKAVREQLSIRTGDRIEFSVNEANEEKLRRMQPAGSSGGCARAFLKPQHKRLTREEERAAMLNEVAAKYSPEKTS